MRFSLFVIVCSFLVAGCSYQQADKVAPLENSFKEGEKFRVTLPEDHTTGYMWQINHNYDESILDYYGSVFRGNEKGVDFNFTALKKGKTTLNFTLIKYRDTSEVRQVIIDIK
ncbi:MAG: protease inhibitor I42 family protein [Bacteroidetes bacterium]|nr:protease inhibitor I42 family protein [Bacteroidota bacterium]